MRQLEIANGKLMVIQHYRVDFVCNPNKKDVLSNNLKSGKSHFENIYRGIRIWCYLSTQKHYKYVEGTHPRKI